MKIVMFTDAYWPRVNGVTVSVESFSRALIRAGHEVVIICSFYPDSQTVRQMSTPTMDKREHDDDPIVIRVPSHSIFISKEDRLAKFHKWFWVSKQLNVFDPDIIHIHSEFVIGEFGFYYAKLYSLPIVYTFHTMWEDYITNYIPYLPKFLLKYIARRIIKTAAARSDTIIAPSLQIQEVLRRYKIKRSSYLIPTGIDPELFSNSPEEIQQFRAEFETKYPLLKGKRILLFAGRIGKEKNISFLFRIMTDIIKKHGDVVLLLAGNGPDLPFFQEEAEEMGLADYCVFSGYLDRKDLSLVYGMSYMFVFPSLTETQGLVTIEAMLSGIPVVAIGEMGTIAVMGGDNGGFMVKNDPEEFTGRVLDLLENKSLYDAKVIDARKHAQSWTIETMTEKLLGAYRDTIQEYNAKKK
ncbi:glycosyltransferase [Brucepastera parasyntrophica]|uniref:glycosyltransferase n=1 Tax=Brucepastera parasyntrophica TaxID=2880008 RepID=UPI00210F0880|nr:glycosyltransferase [Brucepastera parasyntrophica]ULQ59716.1 glycosyltransferase [Brucepastera parasyntrophica]